MERGRVDRPNQLRAQLLGPRRCLAGVVKRALEKRMHLVDQQNVRVLELDDLWGGSRHGVLLATLYEPRLVECNRLRGPRGRDALLSGAPSLAQRKDIATHGAAESCEHLSGKVVRLAEDVGEGDRTRRQGAACANEGNEAGDLLLRGRVNRVGSGNLRIRSRDLQARVDARR